MAATDAATGPVRCRLIHATAPSPGAIAILQITGDVEPVLDEVTGMRPWPVGRARLARLGGIDDGLAVRLADRVAQLMPHGGPRVVQKLTEWLVARGIEPAGAGAAADPMSLYPEARDRYEAMAVAAVARAASPLAIDLLLAQPARWRLRPALTADDLSRSRRLMRLIEPPLVVVAGPADVGKSTLSNALVGRSLSITARGPGTTRDYTSARVDLGGLVVDWHDTPGLRATADPVERRAVELADGLLRRADLVIAMTDPGGEWPSLPRPPDLKVAGKCDLGRRDDADLAVSGARGDGIADLVRAVRDRLMPPEDLAHPGPWLFDERLREAERVESRE